MKCLNKKEKVGHCIVCYIVGAECEPLDLYAIINGESFDDEARVQDLDFYDPSRTHMECINCHRKFDLTRLDKCPYCGKSYPFYRKEEWDQAQGRTN